MNRHGVPSAFQPLTGDGDSIGFSLMDFSLDLVLNKGQDMYVFVLFKPRQISTKVRICMFLSFSSRQFSTKVLKARLCWKLRFPRPTLFLHGNNVAATWIWVKTGTTEHCEIMEQRAACESPNTPALFLTPVLTKCLESGSFYQWPGNWHFWHQVLGISSHSTHCSQALSWESRSCLSST